MSRLRLLSRSVACALIVMSLSRLFYESGGGLVLVPGMMFDGSLIVIIMMLSEPDYYPSIGFALPFNLVFYSASCYAVSCLYIRLKAGCASDSPNSKAVN